MSEKMTAAEVGRKGGQTTKERYGSDHFSKIGRQGGAATMKRYGPKHYAEIEINYPRLKPGFVRTLVD